MIQTVCGKISEEKLGNTLSHEHICILNQEMRFQFPDWFSEDEFFGFALPLLNKLKSYGIDSIIDATPINLGRDINLIKKASQMSGINIIASTGLYFMEEPWIYRPCPEFISELYIKELTEGIGGTDIKAGVIKCASDGLLSEANRSLLRAAAMASAKTGAPVFTHTYSKDNGSSPKNGVKQQEVLFSAGALPEKTLIGHAGDSNDIDYLAELMKNGSFIGLDRFGAEQFNTMEERINTLVKLVELGFANKITLSHDTNFYSDAWHAWDAPHYVFNPKRNMLLLSEYVLPELKARGVSDSDIHLMMHENIKNLFA